MVEDASVDLENSLIATPSSPEPMSGDVDSGEEEMYTDSLTSHTTLVVPPLLTYQLLLHQQ